MTKTVICNNCQKLTGCRCLIQWLPETVYNLGSTVDETIPSPLSDYFLNIIKDYQPLWGMEFDIGYDPIKQLKKRYLEFVWREHIDNTFKCPKGHPAQIGSDWGGGIIIYCIDDNCIFKEADFEF